MQEEENRRTNQESVIGITRLLSAEEVGEILGISARTVNMLVKECRLGSIEITSRERRFTPELVEEFIRAETIHRHPMWDEGRGDL
jgi:excisionase family DNA binding protein